MSNVSNLQWNTGAEWDNAQSEHGVTHESAYAGSSSLQQGFSSEGHFSNNLLYAFLIDDVTSSITDITGSWNISIESGHIGSPSLNDRASILFKGTGSHGALDHYYADTKSHGLTCACWVKWDGTKTNTDGRTLNYDASEYWRMGVDGNNGDSGYFYGRSATDNDGNRAINSSSFPVNTWTLQVGVIDTSANEVRYYEDGTHVATDTTYDYTSWGSGLTRYGFLAEGSEATSQNGSTNGSGVNGDYAFAAVWHRVLSDSSIQELYDLGTSGNLTTGKKIA